MKNMIRYKVAAERLSVAAFVLWQAQAGLRRKESNCKCKRDKKKGKSYELDGKNSRGF
ncbi:MAG: hypothetical protein MR543_10885 [Robinsoniella sp.]|nr:hypothetical protein [Robinsoniella sp.]